jgi:hypothetical protein
MSECLTLFCGGVLRFLWTQNSILWCFLNVWSPIWATSSQFLTQQQQAIESQWMIDIVSFSLVSYPFKSSRWIGKCTKQRAKNSDELHQSMIVTYPSYFNTKLLHCLRRVSFFGMIMKGNLISIHISAIHLKPVYLLLLPLYCRFIFCNKIMKNCSIISTSPRKQYEQEFFQNRQLRHTTYAYNFRLYTIDRAYR